MAIKGKRKGKARSGRVVTPGPRPAYVPPKVPLFQRTGAKFLVVLILEAALFSLIVGFGEQSETDRQREAIKQFTASIDASLASGGAAIQALPGGSLILPELQTRLNELLGEAPPDADQVTSEAEAWAASLTRAADGISAVEVRGEDLEPIQIRDLTEARTEMDRGLRMYVRITEQVRVAAQIGGRPQQELITSLQALLAIASGTFDAGYGKLLDVRQRVDLSATSAVPEGGFPPTELPPGVEGILPPVVEEPVEEVPGGEGGGGGQKGGRQGGKGGGGGQG